jgi:hypothetical protein
MEVRVTVLETVVEELQYRVLMMVISVMDQNFVILFKAVSQAPHLRYVTVPN